MGAPHPGQSCRDSGVPLVVGIVVAIILTRRSSAVLARELEHHDAALERVDAGTGGRHPQLAGDVEHAPVALLGLEEHAGQRVVPRDPVQVLDNVEDGGGAEARVAVGRPDDHAEDGMAGGGGRGRDREPAEQRVVGEEEADDAGLAVGRVELAEPAAGMLAPVADEGRDRARGVLGYDVGQDLVHDAFIRRVEFPDGDEAAEGHALGKREPRLVAVRRAGQGGSSRTIAHKRCVSTEHLSHN